MNQSKTPAPLKNRPPIKSRNLLYAFILMIFTLASVTTISAQLPSLPAPAKETLAAPAEDATAEAEGNAPGKVEVEPVSTDEEIAARLQKILNATDWFQNPGIRVEEGIAFITGETSSETRKKWAGDLARNTRDVVAVVNQINIKRPPFWDVTPALNSLLGLWDDLIATLPLLIFGLMVIIISWLAAKGTTAFLRHNFTKRDTLTRLLREVVARAAGLGVFLLGLYLVLVVVGLARLAVTVLGGTGLAGLIIGIAFRDITENFLASIFLSIQRPFMTGDLVEVDDMTGFVQRLTVRTTVLMSLDGDLVQIPNSTVYKSTLRNYTSNPNRRESFVIGIAYDISVPHAQEVAMDVLTKHPAVLDNPEPWVLVDRLGSSSVELKVYFWLDGTKHSWLKVRSSVIRLVKRAFQEEGITIPDEAREVIVTREVPLSVRLSGISNEDTNTLQQISEKLKNSQEPKDAGTVKLTASPEPEKSAAASEHEEETDEVSTEAEGDLTSESEVAESQAQNTRTEDQGDDLLS